MDIATAQLLERTIGTVRKERRDSEGRLHVSNEPLASAHSLRTLPDGRVLVFHANKPPAVLRMVPYYLQRTLAKRTSVEAAKPDRREVLPIHLVDLSSVDGSRT